MVRQRIKNLEKKINKIQGKREKKIWLINVSSAKSEKERERLANAKQKDIIEGRIQNQDGSYYSDENINYFIISAVPRCDYSEQN